VFEAGLARGLETGLVLDAVIAESTRQSRAFWLIREGLVEAQKHEGGSLKNDVAVPVSRVAAFIDEATRAVEACVPGIRPVVFGHVGDGNIHFNLSQPEGADTAGFMARWDEIQTVVNDIVRRLDGSISAEHGIGRIKRQELVRVKSPVELDLMRAVKAAFDPQGIMNPGTLLP
jgi:FAD/FMN-containing dehydrogenase